MKLVLKAYGSFHGSQSITVIFLGLNLEAPRGGRHLDTEVNEVYISLLPAPPDPEEEEEAVGVEPWAQPTSAHWTPF